MADPNLEFELPREDVGQAFGELGRVIRELKRTLDMRVPEISTSYREITAVWQTLSRSLKTSEGPGAALQYSKALFNEMRSTAAMLRQVGMRSPALERVIARSAIYEGPMQRRAEELGRQQRQQQQQQTTQWVATQEQKAQQTVYHAKQVQETTSSPQASAAGTGDVWFTRAQSGFKNVMEVASGMKEATERQIVEEIIRQAANSPESREAISYAADLYKGMGRGAAASLIPRVVDPASRQMTEDPRGAKVLDLIIANREEILDSSSVEKMEHERRAGLARLMAEGEVRLLRETQAIEREMNRVEQTKRRAATLEQERVKKLEFEVRREEGERQDRIRQSITGGLMVAGGAAGAILHQATAAQPVLAATMRGSWDLLMAEMGRELAPQILNVAGLLQQLRHRFRELSPEVRSTASDMVMSTAIISGATLGLSKLAGIYSPAAAGMMARGGAAALGGVLAGQTAEMFGAPPMVSGALAGGIFAGGAFGARFGPAGAAVGGALGWVQQGQQAGAAAAAAVQAQGNLPEEIRQALAPFQTESWASQGPERMAAIRAVLARYNMTPEREMGIAQEITRPLSGPSYLAGVNTLEGGPLSAQRMREIVGMAQALQNSLNQQGATTNTPQGELNQQQQRAGMLLFTGFQSQAFGIEQIRDYIQTAVVQGPGEQELMRIQAEALVKILEIVQEETSVPLSQRLMRLVGMGGS